MPLLLFEALSTNPKMSLQSLLITNTTPPPLYKGLVFVVTISTVTLVVQYLHVYYMCIRHSNNIQLFGLSFICCQVIKMAWQ